MEKKSKKNIILWVVVLLIGIGLSYYLFWVQEYPKYWLFIVVAGVGGIWLYYKFNDEKKGKTIIVAGKERLPPEYGNIFMDAILQYNGIYTDMDECFNSRIVTEKAKELEGEFDTPVLFRRTTSIEGHDVWIMIPGEMNTLYQETIKYMEEILVPFHPNEEIFLEKYIAKVPYNLATNVTGDDKLKQALREMINSFAQKGLVNMEYTFDAEGRMISKKIPFAASISEQV